MEASTLSIDESRDGPASRWLAPESWSQPRMADSLPGPRARSGADERWPSTLGPSLVPARAPGQDGPFSLTLGLGRRRPSPPLGDWRPLAALAIETALVSLVAGATTLGLISLFLRATGGWP